jgi:UDP-xylose/UDP-N-acetylglucosamine transporter B4
MLTAVVAILVSCGLNNHTLELMLQSDTSFGPLLSLCQFLFVCAVGLVSQCELSSGGRVRLRARTIPLWMHALVSLAFFSTQVLNNFAYVFGMSQPLTLCLRSGGLAVTFLLGRLFFRQSYTLRQFAAVLAIVCGVSLTVLADSSIHVCRDCSASETLRLVLAPPRPAGGALVVATAAAAGASELTPVLGVALPRTTMWLLGVLTLTVALVISAVMGHMQDAAYRRWKRSPDEVMFYSHLLSLPAFFLLGNELSESAARWSASAPFYLWTVPLGPRMWVFLLGNVVTQWMCVRSVYAMTGQYGTLSCTVVLTVRKFLSLLGSVYFFNNEWTLLHWIGTTLVFSGVTAYAAVSSTVTKQKTN